jgi:hypothetical protein
MSAPRAVVISIRDKGITVASKPRQCPCGRWIRWGASETTTRALDCYECEESRKDGARRGIVRRRKSEQ